MPELTSDFDYKVRHPEWAITDIKEVHKVAFYISKKASDWQIVDARGAARFNGEVPEPREGVRSGHITGSVNLPFGDLINAEEGTLKSDKEIAKILLAKNIDTSMPIINSCGSGVTACIVDLALRIMGAENSRVYDGSWTEYVSYQSANSCRVQFLSQTSAPATGTPQVRSDCLNKLN